MPDISTREWRWLAAAVLAILVMINIPYVVGLFSATPQAHFSGFLLGLEDMYSYIAKMRYGARAGWEFQLVYTSELHSGGYVFLPFLGLGKLTALVTGQGAHVSTAALIASFHIARVLFVALLLVEMYLFIAHFVPQKFQRWLAWLIAAMGGGLGWMQVLASLVTGGGQSLPVEYYVPEAFTPLILFTLPHLALARALLLAGWLALFKAIETRSWRWAAAAGVCWLGMSLCVPFFGAVLGLIALVWLSALWVISRRLPLAEIGFAAAAGAPTAIYVAYNAWLFTTNPIFAVWSSQNILPSPPVIEYLSAYGPLLALATPAIMMLVRKGLDRHTALIVMWPIAALAMAYLPINVQRRLLEGMILPLSILAAVGFAGLWNNSSRAKWWLRAGAVCAVCVLVPSTPFFLLGETTVATSSASIAFHSNDELAALEWLAQNAPPDSVVLSTRESGMMLPAYSPVRVYVGHGPETVHSYEKGGLANEFYSDGMDDPARFSLIHDNRIRYVWVGNAEAVLTCKSSGCFDPKKLGLVELFRAGEFSIEEAAP